MSGTDKPPTCACGATCDWDGTFHQWYYQWYCPVCERPPEPATDPREVLEDALDEFDTGCGAFGSCRGYCSNCETRIRQAIRQAFAQLEARLQHERNRNQRKNERITQLEEELEREERARATREAALRGDDG